jgi:hypothetical protein
VPIPEGSRGDGARVGSGRSGERARRRAGPRAVRAGSDRTPAALACPGVLRVPSFHREHLHRQGMGVRGRESVGVQSDRFRRRSDRADGEGGGDAWADPDRQAPRRILPLAVEVHGAFREELAVEGREGGRRPRGRRGVPEARPPLRRLPLALGPEPQGLRPAGVSDLLPEPAARAADRLRGTVHGLVRRCQRRGRLLRGGSREAADRQPDLLRLAQHLVHRPGAPADGLHVQRRRSGLPLGGQRTRDRGRSVLGDARHDPAGPPSGGELRTG